MSMRSVSYIDYIFDYDQSSNWHFIYFNSEIDGKNLLNEINNHKRIEADNFLAKASVRPVDKRFYEGICTHYISFTAAQYQQFNKAYPHFALRLKHLNISDAVSSETKGPVSAGPTSVLAALTGATDSKPVPTPAPIPAPTPAPAPKPVSVPAPTPDPVPTPTLVPTPNPVRLDPIEAIDITKAIDLAIEKNDPIKFRELLIKLVPLLKEAEIKKETVFHNIKNKLIKKNSPRFLGMFLEKNLWGDCYDDKFIQDFSASFLTMSDACIKIFIEVIDDHDFKLLGDDFFNRIVSEFYEQSAVAFARRQHQVDPGSFSIAKLPVCFGNFSNEAILELLKVTTFPTTAIAGPNNKTALHQAFIDLEEEAALELIKKANVAYLNHASGFILDEKTFPWNGNLLDCVILHQNPCVVAALFNKLSASTIRQLLNYKERHYLETIACYMIYDFSFYNDSRLLQELLFFSEIGKILHSTIVTAWQEGINLPSNLQHLIQPAVKEAKRYEFLPLSEYKAVTYDELMACVPRDRAQILWQRGMASLEHYRFIQQSTTMSHEVKWVAKALYDSDLALNGVGRVIRYPETISEEHKSIERIQAVAKETRLLVKIIKPDHFDDIVHQIKAPTYRANIRKSCANLSGPQKDCYCRCLLDARASDKSYKFVHLENKIVLDTHRVIPRTKPGYTHTIKQPTSLEVKEFKMLPFGSHDSSRTSVGIFAEMNAVGQKANAIPKAFLARDTGTFHRAWVGDKKTVEVYATRFQGRKLNYTNVAEFQAQVRRNPYRLNEVLAKLSDVSLCSVVIAKDTKENRLQARLLQQRLPIVLTIAYREPLFRRVRLYSRLEQEEDHIGSRVWLASKYCRLLDKQITDLLHELTNKICLIMATYRDCRIVIPASLQQLHTSVTTFTYASDLNSLNTTLRQISVFTDTLQWLETKAKRAIEESKRKTTEAKIEFECYCDLIKYQQKVAAIAWDVWGGEPLIITDKNICTPKTIYVPRTIKYQWLEIEKAKAKDRSQSYRETTIKVVEWKDSAKNSYSFWRSVKTQKFLENEKIITFRLNK